MKTKRIIFICVTALIVAVITCGTVLAIASFNERQPAEEENNTPTVSLSASEYIREGALAEKKVALSDGKRVAVTYKLTRNNTDGSFIDVYIDKDGKEYRFDEAGEIVGANMSSSDYMNIIYDMVKGDEKAYDSAEKAEEAAREYAKTIFGDDIDNFATVYAKYDDQMIKQYDFTLAKTYGEDGFIQGELCYVNILANGSPISCGSPNMDLLTDFDTGVIDKIKKEDVYAYAEKVAAEQYSDIAKTLEIKKVRLWEENGEIEVMILGHLRSNDTPSYSIEFIEYYPYR